MGLFDWLRNKGSKSSPANLQEIKDLHLRKDLSDYGSRQGGGGKYLEQARAAWNRDDHDSARDLLECALAAELTMPYESLAHSLLGQIWLGKGDIDRAVQHFLKCLEVHARAADALWMSAIRLHIIYDEAGRKEDAERLKALAAAINTRGLSLSPDGEAKIRSLVRATWA
jgi:hypothetical protein